MKIKTYKIKSCDDVELGIKRESELEFRVYFQKDKNPKALIFIIPGCGGDRDKVYRDKINTFVAQNYEVAVVSVDYHCLENRPDLGAKLYFDTIDKIILDELCKGLGLKIIDYDDFIGVIRGVNDKIEYLKQKCGLRHDFRPILSVSIEPTKNEYQNFGIMQAQDIINALLYIKKNPPFNNNKKWGGGIAYYNDRFFTRSLYSLYGK